LQQSQNVKAHFLNLQNAWLDGDMDRLDQLMNASMAAAPGLAERILYARNRDWAFKTSALMGKPGRFFMAVGAAHLAGTQSLIALLEEAGLRAVRLE